MGTGQKYDRDIWLQILEELIMRFKAFVKEDFTCDKDPFIETESSTFSLWLWSNLARPTPLSVSWSCVMAGNPVDGGRFVVTCDLFMFHDHSRKRLCTTDNLSYVQFDFDFENDPVGSWKSNDWIEDEWDEWTDISYPHE